MGLRLVARSPHPGNYILLGLVFGLGVLGKWNFLMFAAALPLAILALPRWRPLSDAQDPGGDRRHGGDRAAQRRLGPDPGPGCRRGGRRALAQDGGGAGFGATVAAGTAELAEALIAFPQPFLPLVLICFARRCGAA